MTTSAENCLRARRTACGLSQAALAQGAGISRQSVFAIESGTSTPAVDVALRLAKVLACRVEDLFATESSPVPLWTDPAEEGSGASGQRVALAHLGGRWLSYPLVREGIGRAADALITASRGRRVKVALLHAEESPHDNMVLMGCAPALGLLAERLNLRGGPGRFLWLPRSSTQALSALALRQTHLAGVHLTCDQTGEANLPDVRRHTRKQAVAIYTLARWQAGLLTAPGNPKQIRSTASLGKRGLRLCVREPGSGARRLLDRELAQAGLLAELAKPGTLQVRGQLEVAAAIAMGAADVGLATRDAALAFGLDFIPVAEERYDLVIPRPGLQDRRLVRLLELLTTAAFRSELSSLGYDTSHSGDRVTEGAAS